jgi:uncharacterized protein YcnI
VPGHHRRLIGAALAPLGVAAAAAAPAGAHVVVQPSAARPADPQIYRVVVPTERDVPTTDVRLRVPQGIDFVLVESPPAGWSGRLVRRADRIAEIRWTGGEIPPDGFAEFRFLARNPVEAGEIRWPVVQRYADGDVQRWIGPADSESPASQTRIAEDVVPQDVVSVNGEQLSSAPATGSQDARQPVPEAGDDGGGRDTLTLVLAVLGTLLGAAALGQSLTARRRSGATA